ncbi:MAG: hypothetical protein KUF79_17385 [Candidatus Thiodiazotropha sp. (ex Ctena orbiculata)]|nr:hypothetical protein [Candidatus Thiodiazotropha taylori]
MANNYKTGVLITGDASGAVKSLKLTRDQLESLNLSKQRGIAVSRDYRQQVSRVSGLLKTMIPVATLAGMGAMVKSTLNAADSVQKMSTRIGASTEALSEYRYVADLTGVQFDALTIGWQRQTRRIAEAAQGYGEARGALKELGLEASDLVKLKPEDQFEAIAAAMAGVNKQSDKVRIGMRLWDSEGVKLLQTINGGTASLAAMRKEARDLGLSMSQDQVDAAAAANDAIKRLSGSAEGLADQLVLKLAPGLTQVIDKFNELAQKEGVFTAFVGSLNKAFSNIMHGVTPELTANEKAILQLETRIRDLDPHIKNITRTMGALKEAGKEGTAEWRANEAILKKYNGVIDDSKKKIANLKESIDSETEATETNTKATRENTKEKENQLKVFENLVFSIDQETKANYEFARTLDDLHAEYVQGNISLEYYNKLVAELEHNTFKAKGSTDTWAVAIAEASVEVDGFADSWEKAGERIDETFADVWKGAFESFSEFKDRLLDGFKTMLAEMAHASISRPILVSMGVLGSGTASAGSGASGVGSLSSLFGGNSLGMGLTNLGDYISPGLLGNAGLYSNAQYGIAGTLGGIGGQAIFGGHGGVGGSLGATVGMAVGGPVGAVIGGLVGGAAGGLFGGDDTPRATYYNSTVNAGFEDDVSVKSAFGYLGLRDQGSKNIKAADLRQSLEAIAAIDNLIANTFGAEAVQDIQAALDGWAARDNKADDFMDRMFDRFNIIVQEIDFRFSDIAQLGAESLEEIATRLLTFKEISDFIDSNVLADHSDLLADAARSLRDHFNNSASAIYRLGDAYDGTTEATTELAGALTVRYQLELQYLSQIQSVQQGLNDTIQGSIESIRLSVMDTQQQYDYFSGQAEALAASLSGLVDPAEINAVVQDINSLTNQAYNLLTADQRADVSTEFVDFLEGVLDQANDQLDAERDRAASESETLRNAMVEAMETGAERMAQRLESVAAQQQQAANTLANGVSLFAQSLPVRVNVSYSGEFGGEVG